MALRCDCEGFYKRFDYTLDSLSLLALLLPVQIGGL